MMFSDRFVPLAAVLLLIALPACNGDDDPAATNLGEDAVGMCLDIPPDQNAEVTELPSVDCDQPHTHEVFGVFEVEVDGDVYPGFEALEAEAQGGCFDLFEGYVGISPFDSSLFYSWIVPTLGSWTDENLENTTGAQKGDREVICIVGLSGDRQIESGVLRDSNR